MERDQVVSQGAVQLTTGVPFISDSDLEAALDETEARPEVADAIVDDNADPRIVCVLRWLFSIVAVIAARRLPNVQPSDPVGGRGGLGSGPGRAF